MIFYAEPLITEYITTVKINYKLIHKILHNKSPDSAMDVRYFTSINRVCNKYIIKIVTVLLFVKNKLALGYFRPNNRGLFFLMLKKTSSEYTLTKNMCYVRIWLKQEQWFKRLS